MEERLMFFYGSKDDLEKQANIKRPMMSMADVNKIRKSVGKIDEKTGLPRNLTHNEAIEIANLILENATMGDIMTDEERSSKLISAQQSMSNNNFAAALADAGTVPIAKFLIEQTTIRDIFPIVQIPKGMAAKKYTLTEREKAFWTGKYGSGANSIVNKEFFWVQTDQQMVVKELALKDLYVNDFDIVANRMDTLPREMFVNEEKDMIELFFKASSRGRNSTDSNAKYPYGTSSAPTVATYEENCLYLPSGDVPIAQDVNKAIARIKQRNLNADVMWINPYPLHTLVTQSDFIHAANFGSNEVIQTGTIKQLFGLKIMVSNLLPQDRFYILDSKMSGEIVQLYPMYVNSETEKTVRIMLYGISDTANVIKNINGIEAIQTYNI